MEALELVKLLPWGVVFALFTAAKCLREGLREQRAAQLTEVFLSPALRIPELAPYSGPPGPAVAALRARGIRPEQVDALMLFRGEAPGLWGPDSLPAPVRVLVASLSVDGSARGPEVNELLLGGELPPGRCLWFVQLTGVAGQQPQVVAFAGPDRGVSDLA